MPVTAGFALPHPPVIIPEVGGGREKEVQKTIDSYSECAEAIARLKPETIILASPHSVMYSDYFHISPGNKAYGDFRRFGVGMVKINAVYDDALVKAIEEKAAEKDISAGTFGEREPELDHGTMTPLYFINKFFSDYKLVRIGLSGFDAAEHYKFGRLIADCVNELDRRAVFVASGDLSHKTAPGGPYGYAEEGVRFDKEITEAFESGDFMKLLSFSPEFAEKAAECGLRSFIIMAGAFDGKAVKSKLRSYEGTLGVGYGIASFIPEGDDESRRFLKIYQDKQRESAAARKGSESGYVSLARYSAEYYVNTGKKAPLPEKLPEGVEAGKRAGVFVSLKKNGILRGCIGTISPAYGSVAEEIIQNAISAAARDPRFPPVAPDELDSLVYSVDILSEPEPVSGTEFLDAKRYGVIVSSGYKRGLLLPNLDGVDTVEEQVAIAMQKAGISAGEPVLFERFEVIRYR